LEQGWDLTRVEVRLNLFSPKTVGMEDLSCGATEKEGEGYSFEEFAEAAFGTGGGEERSPELFAVEQALELVIGID
jgi:hypothetical protein